MPPHPQIVDFLAAVEAAGIPSFHELDAADSRAMYRKVVLKRRGGAEGDPVAAVTDADAAGVPVRVYRPEGDARAALVFFHGGGWVVGDLDTHDHQARSFAHHAGVVVVSVDYRLAPEHPFPAALDDCVTATRWAAQQLGDWDVDRLAVGGDSAGGNLAAAVALELRGSGLSLAAQVLVYPAVDATMSHPSIEENAEGYYLEKADMEWFMDHYGADADRRDPRLSPEFADDLSALPPAVVVTAEFDPLRDEGEAYARALEAAGVPVRLTRFDGLIHGFFGMGGIAEVAQQAVEQTCHDLAAVLDTDRDA